MRILFFHPQTRHSPVAEWGLDLIQCLIRDGHDVTVLTCGGELASCEINLQHRYSVCDKCIAKRRGGFALLDGSFTSAPFLKLSDANRREIAALPASFDSIDDLKRFEFDGCDLGMAAASSLISCTRDPEPDMRTHSGTAVNLVRSAVAVYRSIQNWLSESTFDRVYIFNGRTATFRAAFRAALKLGVDCHIYENANSIHAYQHFLNHLPHDIAYTHQLALETWTKSADTPAERELTARQFFEKASRGKSLINFVKHQDPTLLPEGFDPARKNIVLFNSSEDEMAAIGAEWANPMYDSQLAGLQRIRADIDQLPADLMLYLRMHPHLRGVTSKFVEVQKNLDHPRFKVIPPESSVSSYALMQAASTVVTFGSTMGVEATYARRPSILSGGALYRDFGATYNPASHAELFALLTQPLDPKPLEAALQYGFFLEAYGEPFTYYKPQTLHTGEFKGHRVSYGKWRDYFWGGIECLPLFATALDRRYLENTLSRLGAPLTPNVDSSA